MRSKMSIGALKDQIFFCGQRGSEVIRPTSSTTQNANKLSKGRTFRKRHQMNGTLSRNTCLKTPVHLIYFLSKLCVLMAITTQLSLENGSSTAPHEAAK